MEGIRSAGVCLQADGVEELEGASLFWVGSGGDLEGRGVVTGLGSTAGVTDDVSELLLQSAEAVCGGAVVEEMGGGLGFGGCGAFRRCDRIAGGLGELILVGEEQRSLGISHVPIDVVGEHAEVDVAFDPFGEMGVYGAYI